MAQSAMRVVMTHVLIIGSGIAGPVLSMALQRAGIESTLFERDAAGAEERGAWLNFQANGMDALQAIDAAGPVEKLGYPVDTISLPVVRRWHDDASMIIIGDAAHASSPAAGQGAAMALEDAVILAQCLRDCPDTRTAFTTFDSLRRARVERIVKDGHRRSAAKTAGPVGRFVRDLVLPVVFGKVARNGGESMMWLQGHHIDFSATPS
jgi:2-polyprenyl-6-methoxyphenol hydroxylase-like FAD-dependent oxidoreductase